MADLKFILKGKFFPPAQIATSFKGKTVIVTGSNTGVGFAAALKYAQLEATTLILGVRNKEKGQLAKEKIETSTGRKNVIQVWELDMERFESIDAFARRADGLEKLDIAVLNAGVLPKKFTLSDNGWESDLQVNTLGTALLAILLTPKLQTSRTPDSPAHLSIVASTGHIDVALQPVQDGQLLHHYNVDVGIGQYMQHLTSKLFMMWITRELASRCKNKDGKPTVIVNDCCPGSCRSDVAREFDSIFFTIVKSIGSILLLRPAEYGARVIVGSTTLGEESHGRWWSSDGEFKM